MLVHFLTIYSPLPSNWRHNDKLTHISGHEIVSLWPATILLPSELAASAPSPDAGPLGPRQLRVAPLIQRDSLKSRAADRHRSKPQLRDTELCPTQRKGQLFPK